ncbi:tachylectin-related carbohydrate-binding protein [Streptomyces sp. NPDC005784]|uniref:tachylectin-related carbohydrate-binding protein n=1 Tax=Streptomyces sp. NPDC005784 TaxID=3364731 RepID=UPI0036A47FF6
MGFTQLASGDIGIIYGVHDDGRLLFYKDESRDGSNAANGSTGWSRNTGHQVGQHFEAARLLTGSGDGTLYMVHQDGRLLFYKDESRDGSNAANGSTGWSRNTGHQVGQHFEGARLLTGSGDGTLYMVHQDGRLLFYKDEWRDGSNAANGSTGWSRNTGHQIGQHFEAIKQIVGGGDGILYAVHQDGRLLFFKDEFQDGSNAPDGSTGWSKGSGNQVGQGWA